MKNKSESVSVLPWLWVIEALAGVKDLDMSTLHDLIDAAPVRPEDLGKNSRELVAMRCLEVLGDCVRGINGDASSSLESKIEVDYSQSCEDVLLHTLHEIQIPLSNLRMAGEELMKWDLHPIVMHKRATTTKCYLEQLKEQILEGTYPYVGYLKERGGLALVNVDHPFLLSDGKCGALSRKGNEHLTDDAESMGANGNPMSLVPENGSKSFEKYLHDKKLSTSKRIRVGSFDEDITGNPHDTQVGINECNNFLRNVKKIKCYASSSVESSKDKPVPQQGLEVSENSIERVSEKPCQHLVELVPTNVVIPYETQYKVVGHESRSKNDKDLPLKDPNCCLQKAAGDKDEDDTGCGVQISNSKIGYQDMKTDLAIKEHEILIPQCISGHNSLPCSLSTEKFLGIRNNEGVQLLVSDITMPQHISEDEPRQNASSDETKGDIEYHIEAFPKNVDVRNKIQLNSKESQYKYKLKFQPKEPNAMSQNDSQQLFAGKEPVIDVVNGCDVEMSNESDEFHIENIDLAAKKYELLNSQCMLSHELAESSERTAGSICMKCNEGGQLLVCKTTTCPLVFHESCLGSPASCDAKGDFLCPFCAYSFATSEYLEVKEKASLARKDLATFICKVMGHRVVKCFDLCHQKEHIPSKKSKHEHLHAQKNRKDKLSRRADQSTYHVKKVNNHQFQKSQHQPLCLERQISNNRRVRSASAEKDGEEWINPESSTVGVSEVNLKPIDRVDVVDKFSSKRSDIVSIDPSNGGEGLQLELPEQHITDQIENPAFAHDTEEKHIYEDESKKSIISTRSMRSQKQTLLYKPQASPNSRRKQLPWSAEEEEILIEGMHKFANVSVKEGKRIPWKEILAFGSGVFQKVRTTVDLKDKWRNLCHANLKSK